MSEEEQQSEPDPQPDAAIGILAVPITRHLSQKAPNRANRNRYYDEAVVFRLGDTARKLRVLVHKKDPQILFVMPDGVVYEANARMMIEHVVADWQTPAETAQPEASPIEPES